MESKGSYMGQIAVLDSVCWLDVGCGFEGNFSEASMTSRRLPIRIELIDISFNSDRQMAFYSTLLIFK